MPKRQILEYSKLKEFAKDNFKFDENDRKFSTWVENTVGKGEIVRSHGVFKGLVQETCKNQGLFGKGLTPCPIVHSSRMFKCFIAHFYCNGTRFTPTGHVHVCHRRRGLYSG